MCRRSSSLSACLAATVTVLAFSAGARAASTTVTATAVRISDRPAFVQAVVDLTGRTTGANAQVMASDAQPLDGRASLQFILGAGARTTAAPQSRFGLTVRIARTARGLGIALLSRTSRFKYLSYRWASARHLAIVLWKASPPGRGAAIARGVGGCLTLDAVAAHPADGTVVASGREKGIFEHQFRVVVRGADGRTTAARTAHARNGRWRATLFPVSPWTQPGTLEAAVLSPGDGSLACLVQQRISIPFTGPRPLRLVRRAHADLDGDRRADLLTFGRMTPEHGIIRVRLGTDRTSAVTTDTTAVALPALAAVGNVDGRAGDELFVDVEHISTNEFIGVFTWWHRGLRLAATLAGYSAHPGLWAGMTCGRRGGVSVIIVHQFVLGPNARWTRQDTDYVWRGPRVTRSAEHPAVKLPGLPSPALVGLHCGHAPASATASHRAEGSALR